MPTAIHKMRSAAFYLQRPNCWLHFGHRALRYVQQDLDAPALQRAATDWARERAQPLPQVLLQLGLIANVAAPLPRMEPEIVRAAQRRITQSQCRMGGGADTGLLYAVTRLTGATRVIETGVAFGWSSLAFLSAMAGGDGRLVSVDRPYPGDGTEAFVGLAVPERLKDRWTIIAAPDRNGLKRATAKFPQGVDIVHYDSDKSYRGRKFGYAILWAALRPGGIFLSDDIQDNLAFAHFVARRGLDCAVLDVKGKYAGIVIKPGTRPASAWQNKTAA